MELEEAIANLEEYIKLDEKYIDYDDSDFAKFCKNHCEDIQKVLHYIKEESIPRAVIEEKRKIILKEGENMTEEERQKETMFLQGKLIILEELLNKGEK